MSDLLDIIAKIRAILNWDEDHSDCCSDADRYEPMRCALIRMLQNLKAEAAACDVAHQRMASDLERATRVVLAKNPSGGGAL